MAITQEDRDIVINGWENGISDDPYNGIYDMRNVDPSSVQGEVGVAMRSDVTNTQAAISAVTFTVNTNNILTYNGAIPIEVNTVITVATSGSLPTGLSTSGRYYVKAVTSTTFTLSSVSAGGTELAITSGTGSGTHTFTTIQMARPVYIVPAYIIGFYSLNLKLYFTLDSNGRCWVRDSSVLGGTNKWVYMRNLTSESSTQDPCGLIAWKNYLFIFEFNDIRVNYLDRLDGTIVSLATLTTDTWQDWESSAPNTSVSGISHQAIVDSQRDAIYFCNDNAIGTIAEVDGAVFGLSPTATIATGSTTDNSTTITTGSAFFTQKMVGCVITSSTGLPTGARIATVNSSTSAVLDLNSEATSTGSGRTFTVTQSYTISTDTITIPSGDQTTCLAELGGQILIGGINNVIYPWDKISQGYGNPIFLAENFTSRMVTVNTTAYIFCGRKGNIYQTNGSNVSLFKTLPTFLSETLNPNIRFMDAIFNRDQLYFGVRVLTNSGTTINKYGGLWTIDLKTGALYMSNQMSYGTYSGYVSALCSFRGDNPTTISLTNTTSEFGNDQGYGLLAGWYDGSVYNIDKTVSAPYVSGQAYVIGDMIPVGQYLTKRTFENVEYKLATPLVSGESVAIGYRTNITDAFTDIPITQGGATGDLSGIGNINFENAQWVQLKATMTSTASSPSYVRLRDMRIR